jgi:hypothetical protein
LSIPTGPRLKAFGTAAAARHALYLLLAVLTLEAEIHPTGITAVGCLVGVGAGLAS